ncbi:MAG TPA: hypothetical protein DEP19_00375 [Anaerolineae bacterium]|nr:hypothetical protein [Anaerolineae bacterium]HCK66356.1 hypothetical protein [Anaerolineae bacterium]
MQKLNYLLTTVLIFLPTSIALSIYAYIGTFNRLLGDSLCSFYYAERLGLFRSIWFWRITWSGRYSAYAFDWLTTKFFDEYNIIWFTPLILIFWLVINTLGIYLLFKQLDKNNVWMSILLGALSVCAILVLTPTIEQSFFWIDGFRAYTLPSIILAMYFVLYLFFDKKIKSKLIAFVLEFLLFFASGGLSETFAVFQFCLIIFWIGYYWLSESPKTFDKNLFILIGSGLGSLLAIIAVATAHGNSVRQSFFPPPPSLIEILSISSTAYLNFWSEIVLNPAKISILIGVILFCVWVGSLYKAETVNIKRKIIFQILGAFLLSFICFPPGVYGYSEPPPARVLSISVFIIVVLFMSASVRIGNLLSEKFIQNKTQSQMILWVSMLLIFFAAWADASEMYKGKDVYIEYAQKWDATDLLIKQAIVDGKDVVEIPADPSWAGMDLPNQNPNHWVNECYSFFYGIQVFGPPR